MKIICLKYETCGMTVSLDLRLCSPIELVSLPSMIIFPDAASMIRNKDRATVDLPAPVRPTTPIYQKTIWARLLKPHCIVLNQKQKYTNLNIFVSNLL